MKRPSLRLSALRGLLVIAVFLGLALAPRVASAQFTVVAPIGGTAATPSGPLLIASNGLLYGVTTYGGDFGQGTLFSVAKDGSNFTVVYSFTGGDDGFNPVAPLIQGSDGRLYGTSIFGGSSNAGSVFAINLDGSGFTTIHSFDGSDGIFPYAPVMQGPDGRLYGTTSNQGAGGAGTVFAMATDGSGFTSLYAFLGGSDGGAPLAPLILGKSGLLYGTASTGGASGAGTVYSIATNGTSVTPIYNFSGGTDGGSPEGPVVEDANGVLYGVTNSGGPGGSSGAGVIYSLSATGTYTLLHSFNGPTDGQNPGSNQGLVLGADLNLYGTTPSGGANGVGTVFQASTNGSAFTAGYAFLGTTDGGNPDGALVQDPSSLILYGTASGAAASTSGVVYAVQAPPPQFPPVITSALTDAGAVGSPYSYTITASNVPTSFNATGLPAGFSVNSSTGVISGTPTVAGTFNIGISATNAYGTGSATLTVTFNVIAPFATLNGPVGLAFSSAGTLYVANYTGGTVLKVTSAGAIVSPAFATGFNVAAYPAFDTAGNLYVSDTGANVVRKTTPGGVTTTFATGFSQPVGVAFDSAGTLYVANFANGTVSKVTTGGVVSTFVSGFTGPTGLAFDAAGNLYVSNANANTISKVTPAGVVSTFASGPLQALAARLRHRGQSLRRQRQRQHDQQDHGGWRGQHLRGRLHRPDRHRF